MPTIQIYNTHNNNKFRRHKVVSLNKYCSVIMFGRLVLKLTRHCHWQATVLISNYNIFSATKQMRYFIKYTNPYAGTTRII